VNLSCFRWSHDIQHNDTQHNNIQHNDTQHNDIYHNEIQHNNIQHNNIQHNNIQNNDTQHNVNQKNDNQHVGNEHNDTRRYNIKYVTLQHFKLGFIIKLSMLGVVILGALAPVHLELQSMNKQNPMACAINPPDEYNKKLMRLSLPECNICAYCSSLQD
jgi:hypothetical protein